MPKKSARRSKLNYLPRRLDKSYVISKDKSGRRRGKISGSNEFPAADRRELRKKPATEFTKLKARSPRIIPGTAEELYEARGVLRRWAVNKDLPRIIELIKIVDNSKLIRDDRQKALVELREFEKKMEIPPKDRIKTPEDLL